MAIELVLAPEAEQDIQEAYRWYELQRAGLGEEFLRCIEACVQALHRAPLTYPVVHESYRRALPRRSNSNDLRRVSWGARSQEMEGASQVSVGCPLDA